MNTWPTPLKVGDGLRSSLIKRKPDDEFANINLGYFDPDGNLIIVFCPESREAVATQNPSRTATLQDEQVARPDILPPELVSAAPSAPVSSAEATTKAVESDNVFVVSRPEPKERHYRIHYGATGYSYESIFGDYLPSAEEIVIEDPYIRQQHQIINFLRFCETAVRVGKPKKIALVTCFENQFEKDEAMSKLFTIAESLKQFDVVLEIKRKQRSP